MRKFLLFIFALFPTFSLMAQGSIDGHQKSNPDYAELDAYINFRAEKNRYSGVSAIFQDSTVVFSSVKGIANRDWGVPISWDTKFDLASATKMFTAIGTAILYEEGRLSLDSAFTSYLKDFPLKNARHITIKQLLSHTSGFNDLFFENAYLQSDRSRLRKLSDYDRYFSILKIGEVPPNRILYSNSNFIILGRIIEEVSGMDYYQFIEEHIFSPLGMHNSGFFDKDEIVEKRALGYYNDAQASMEFGVPNNDQDRSNIAIRSIKGMPAGGAFSTVEDMNRFMLGIQNGGLISKNSFELFTREYAQGYALGFQSFEQDGQRLLGHSGGFYGVSTMVFWLEGFHQTFISLTNLDFAAQPIFDRYLAIKSGQKSFTPMPLPADKFAPFKGFYEIMEGESKGKQIYIEAMEDRLLFDHALEFFPYEKDAFFDIDNDAFNLVFKRNSNGEISGFQRGDQRRFKQVALRIDSSQLRSLATLKLSDELLQEYNIELIFQQDGMMPGHRPSISIENGALVIDQMMKFLPFEKDKFFLHDDSGMQLHFLRGANMELTGAEVYREKERVGKLQLYRE